MKALIVDDEGPARSRLRRLLEEIAGVEVVGEAENGLAALRLVAGLHPEVLFLDIQMPLLGGFETIEALRGPDAPLIVFVTSYDRYALDAFEASAVDYLLKPVARERLEKAVAKAARLLEGRTGAQATREAIERITAALAQKPRPLNRLVGKRGQKIVLISPADVQAFVADDELVFALIREGRLLVNYTLRDLEERLDGERFVRVHKETIVNLSHLVELDPVAKGGAMGRLACGATVEISRRYAVALRQRLGW